MGTDAERVEGRASPKGNGGQTAAARTLRRDTASNGLAAVRRAARQRKTGRFTALLHHITTDLLKQSYLALTRDACARDRRSDVASLRRKPRRETERPARANASGQLPGPTGQTDVHPEGGRSKRPLSILCLEVNGAIVESAVGQMVLRKGR